MAELDEQKCRTCHTGELPLSEREILTFRRQVPNWDVKEVNGVKRLERVFQFQNFAQTRLFVDQASRIAEQENHHPLVVMEHTRVTLNLWTHKVNGLHLNDFIMAAKMDKLRKSFPDR